MRLLPVVIALSLAAAASYADTITLKNGRVINGTYLGGTPRQIKMEVGDDIQTLDVGDIARIEFSNGGYTSSRDVPRDDGRPTLRRADSGSSSGSSAPNSRTVILQPDPNDSGSSGSSGSSYPSDNSRPTLKRSSSDSSSSDSSSDSSRPTLRRASPDSSSSSSSGDDGRPVLRRATPDASTAAPAQTSAAPAPPVQIPAQTELVVRLIDAVDSQTAKEGDVFRASLDQPIVINGQTVIQRGADAQVKLVQAQQSGKFTGKTELTLSLWSVTASGKVIEINTQNITKASDSRGAQTAKVAGGAAAVGAVIGAIAGGGKGAAVGAGAGGAAGAGVQAATKGQRVKVASETLLTFVLDKPVDPQAPGAAAAQPAAQPPTQPAAQPSPQVAEVPPPAPPVQPPPPAPVNIKVGQTQDDVITALGQPDSVSAQGSKEIYVYTSRSLTVTFVNGKVSKVE